jgi:tetratricopeptide (TPR) repeat protein
MKHRVAPIMAAVALMLAAHPAQAQREGGLFDRSLAERASERASERQPAAASLKQLFSPLRAALSSNTTHPLAELLGEVLELLSQSKLPEASAAINAALKLDASNASLHVLNGLVYHLMARQGDSSKSDTAIEGYRSAIRFEPANWVAHEFLGLAYFEKRDYGQALGEFAEVLLQRPDDPDVMLRAMAAAYLGGDAGVACAMADRLRAQPAAALDRAFLRGSVLVYAACGRDDTAQQQKALYFKLPLPDEERQRIDLRLADWRYTHRQRTTVGDAGSGGAAAPASDGAMLRAQYTSPGLPPPGSYPTYPGAVPGMSGPSTSVLPETAKSSGSDRMVLVDVVMIRTEDSITTSKGVNLLSALNLQFGSSTQPAYGRTTVSQAEAGVTTIVQRAITVPALTYTLNIANANKNLNEVLARPTITALEGVRSEFFSGTVLNAAVVSGGTGFNSGSVSVEKRYGVRLALLPQILENGMVRLAIDASRTFLKPPSSDIAFTYKLEISEILVNANVVMQLGDTLILSGLSERESTSVRDGVPVLQDIPVAQYLFSRKTQTEYQKSVLILITPRPAAYTWLSEETKAALSKKRDAFSPSMDVLRARYSDWFKPYPNLASVFHHFNAADLYREFRTGDVTIEQWERKDSTSLRLKNALEFLYY